MNYSFCCTISVSGIATAEQHTHNGLLRTKANSYRDVVLPEGGGVLYLFLTIASDCSSYIRRSVLIKTSCFWGTFSNTAQISQIPSKDPCMLELLYRNILMDNNQQCCVLTSTVFKYMNKYLTFKHASVFILKNHMTRHTNCLAKAELCKSIQSHSHNAGTAHNAKTKKSRLYLALRLVDLLLQQQQQGRGR